jgi:hypothetical protein
MQVGIATDHGGFELKLGALAFPLLKPAGNLPTVP